MLNSNENFSENLMYIEEPNSNPNQNNTIQESENEELATLEKGKKRKLTPQYWKRKMALNQRLNGDSYIYIWEYLSHI